MRYRLNALAEKNIAAPDERTVPTAEQEVSGPPRATDCFAVAPPLPPLTLLLPLHCLSVRQSRPLQGTVMSLILYQTPPGSEEENFLRL